MTPGSAAQKAGFEVRSALESGYVKLHEAMKEEGSQKAAEIFETARVEIVNEKLAAEKKVADQLSRARKQLEEESRALAATIMEKVLERRVQP